MTSILSQSSSVACARTWGMVLGCSLHNSIMMDPQAISRHKGFGRRNISPNMTSTMMYSSGILFLRGQLSSWAAHSFLSVWLDIRMCLSCSSMSQRSMLCWPGRIGPSGQSVQSNILNKIQCRAGRTQWLNYKLSLQVIIKK